MKRKNEKRGRQISDTFFWILLSAKYISLKSYFINFEKLATKHMEIKKKMNYLDLSQL